jgi:DNA-binding GntR family transcriptional regulator
MQHNQADLVYEALKEAIMRGELAPGTKLSEPAIAERMNISRAPVREAVRRLQERGLVDHIVNRGTRVISPTLEDFLALLDVREALEGMASRLAATAMSDADVAALKILVEAHGRSFGDDSSVPYIQDDFDTDFHVRIAKGCGNPVLEELLCGQFYPRLKLCRQRHRAVRGRGFLAWKEHERVMSAIVDRDGETAELLMRRHVRSARQALLEAAAPDADGSSGPRRDL